MDIFKKIFASAAFALLAVSALNAQESYVHDQSDGYEWPTDPQVLQKLDEWQDLKFGVLMHWGLYSVPGIVESWQICNEDWIRRPEGSTYEGYKQWYWGLCKDFNPVDFDPAQWASVFDDAGMKYMIFTTKHHDGFCMFDSEYTDFSVAKAGPFANDPRRDIARHVFDAFRAKDFMIGAYFSKPDWHCEWFWNPYYATANRHANYKIDQHPDWWDKYVAFTKNQLGELTGGRYGRIDILWLDGGWIEGEQVGLDEVLVDARKVSPGLISVDRTIKGPNENYQTPEHTIPPVQLNHPWETCMPLGGGWGWSPRARFKSARRVIDILAEITAKGGSLALGVGPTPEGLIQDEVVTVLKEVGDWMRRCGESMYSTRITPVYNDGSVWFNASKDGKTLYAIYALADDENLPSEISWSGNIPSGKVTILNNGKKVKATVKDGVVTVKLPKGLAQEPVALKFGVAAR